MLSLYWMGPPLERLVGPHTFAVIYATSIVSGGLLHFWLGPPFSMALGSSGERSFQRLPHFCWDIYATSIVCQAAFCTIGWALTSAWRWSHEVRGAVCCQVPKVLAALPLHQRLNDCCFMQPAPPLPSLTAGGLFGLHLVGRYPHSCCLSLHQLLNDCFYHATCPSSSLTTGGLFLHPVGRCPHPDSSSMTVSSCILPLSPLLNAGGLFGLHSVGTYPHPCCLVLHQFSNDCLFLKPAPPFPPLTAGGLFGLLGATMFHKFRNRRSVSCPYLCEGAGLTTRAKPELCTADAERKLRVEAAGAGLTTQQQRVCSALQRLTAASLSAKLSAGLIRVVLDAARAGAH